MDYVLVGSKGAVAVGSSGAALTTLAWGAGESRTAGNLLILMVNGYGSATFPTTPSGWTLGNHRAAGTSSCSILYKIATGGDAAPTIGAVASTTWIGQLMEYDGNAASPLEDSGTGSDTSGVVTATCVGTDTYLGNLLAMNGLVWNASARVNNLGVHVGNFASTSVSNNNGSSTRLHYDFTTAIINDKSVADHDSYSYDSTVVTNALVVICSFTPLVVAYTESATIKSKTKPSSSETKQQVESATIDTTTTPSATEIHAIPDTRTVKGVTSLSAIETKQSADASTIKGITTPHSADIVQYADVATIKSITTPRSTSETSQYIESRIIKGITTPLSADVAEYVESHTVIGKSYPISGDLFGAADAAICSSITTILSDELVGKEYLDSDFCRSTTGVLGGDEAPDVDSDTIRSNTTLIIHVSYDFVDSATITSTTTIVEIAEVQYIVELVGYAYKHFIGEVDKHFDAQAVTRYAARQ